MITERPKILVIDDEESIIDLLELGLSQNGFDVVSTTGGSGVLQQFTASAPHLVILDLMLPDIDGLTICRQIRARSEIPILMLTARGSVDDKVEGLQSGADDYLSKPFKFRELLARVQALLRRSGLATGNRVAFGDLVLDREMHTVTQNGRAISLTGREFELLDLFMSGPRRVFTREKILTRLWGYDFDGETNVVEVYVRTLRLKLGDETRTLIRAIRGVGYTLGG